MGVSVVLARGRCLYAELPYDALRDFAPVSRVGSGAYLLAVHSSLPVQSVQELVALAKARPAQLHYASGGVGSGQRLASELFKCRASIQLTHIAYKGGPPAVAAVMSGESEVGFMTVTASHAQVSAGKLKALGVSSPAQLPLLPQVPTIAESGYAGLEVTPIFGFYVPAATPKDIVATLKTVERKAVVAGSSTPDELGKLAAAEIEQ